MPLAPQVPAAFWHRPQQGGKAAVTEREGIGLNRCSNLCFAVLKAGPRKLSQDDRAQTDNEAMFMFTGHWPPLPTSKATLITLTHLPSPLWKSMRWTFRSRSRVHAGMTCKGALRTGELQTWVQHSRTSPGLIFRSRCLTEQRQLAIMCYDLCCHTWYVC